MISSECSRCDWRGPDADISRCPDCAGILVVAYADPAIAMRPEQPGLWRYGAHLPLRDLANAVSLGEGNTPLLEAPRLARQLSRRPRRAARPRSLARRCRR